MGAHGNYVGGYALGFCVANGANLGADAMWSAPGIVGCLVVAMVVL